MRLSSFRGTLRCSFVDEMQPIAVLFSQLFCRNNFASKVCELNKLLLDRLQPFVSLYASELSICPIRAVTAKLLI